MSRQWEVNAQREPGGSPAARPGAVGGPAAGSRSLLERLKAGEHEAFESLVCEHGGRLLAVARHFLASEEDARDAVQEAFLSAFRALPRFRGESSLSTWLHRIVINAALMKARRASRAPERRIEELLPRFDGQGRHLGPVEPWDEAGASPEAVASNAEARQAIRACVQSLPLSHRVVLILRDVEGLSTHETARLLALTPNAVKIRLHRARLALRGLLAPHFGPRRRSLTAQA
ncbi:MAG: sigma-70 family RNA polymerase sigma factor [Acidobacteriota bacterium]